MLFANLSFASDRFSSLSEELLQSVWEQEQQAAVTDKCNCICSSACQAEGYVISCGSHGPPGPVPRTPGLRNSHQPVKVRQDLYLWAAMMG